MGPLKRLALRLSKTSYVKRAIEERADLSAFKARPSPRLLGGVGLIGLGQLMGLPAVAGFGAAAAWFEEPLLLLGAPTSYLISWVVWAAGMWLAGPDNIKYLNALLKWGVRLAVERILGDSLKPPAGQPEWGENTGE